jgi:hypothetical protein
VALDPLEHVARLEGEALAVVALQRPFGLLPGERRRDGRSLPRS